MVLRGWGRRNPDEPELDPSADGPDAGDGTAPDTLGARFRSAREEGAFTLEQAAEETRINYGYLDAMEADRFDVLPAPVYTRGFVRLYARFLGIDPEEAIEQLPDNLPLPPGLEPLPGLRRSEGAGVLPAIERRWVVLAVLAVAAIVVVFIVGVPGVDLPGTGDDEAAATPAATAEATETPTEVRMPDLAGRDRAEAEQALRDLGIPFVVIEVESSQAPAGQVFEQTPSPGEVLAPNQPVTLLVAKQPAAAGE